MSTALNKPYKKYLSITLLGFASGLPYMLIFSTLATWLAFINVDIKTIGFFAWVVLTYSLKVFWAPLIDTFSIPIALSVFAAKADLPPAAQKSTVSLFWSMALCIENSNNPLEICSAFSILPSF